MKIHDKYTCALVLNHGFKPSTCVHVLMQVILYILMGKLSSFHPDIRVTGYHVYHLQQRWDLFKCNIPKFTDLDSCQYPRLFSEQQRSDAARKAESAAKSDNEVCGSSVPNTKRAGCRAVISVLKRQWSRVIRVRHSRMTTKQISSSQAGPRPGQETKPAGPGQTHRSGRLGRVIAATQI